MYHSCLPHLLQYSTQVIDTSSGPSSARSGMSSRTLRNVYGFELDTDSRRLFLGPPSSILLRGHQRAFGFRGAIPLRQAEHGLESVGCMCRHLQLQLGGRRDEDFVLQTAEVRNVSKVPLDNAFYTIMLDELIRR